MDKTPYAENAEIARQQLAAEIYQKLGGPHMSIRQPRLGDRVHVSGWKQPNGEIIYVEEGDAVVVFSKETEERTEFDYDTVCSSWTDRFDGCYMLNAEDY